MGYVKASTEQYRTFKGLRFICWLCFPSPERITAYRDNGIRCARRGGDLYVADVDTDKALEVDRLAEARP